jgi:hypothetical protein
VDKPDIEVKSQWRHKRRHSFKVRVTRVWDATSTLNRDMWAVSYDIHDPERNLMPWRNSDSVAADLFLESYEPDLPAVVVLQDEATGLVAELIAKVEENVAPELVRLRGRIDNVLQFLDGVATPNVHTLSHIRRMLTTDDKY